MSISASDFNNMLKEFVKSSEGKQLVKQYSKDVYNGKISSSGNGNGMMFSKNDMKRIANDLRNIIYAEIRGAGITSYDIKNIIVESPFESITGDYVVKLSFPSEALKRKSLWVGGDKNGGYTGTGVYDIIGLFVSGYYTPKRVWGYWVGHDNPPSGIGSVNYREPNDFISRAVTIFLHKYKDKGIKVSYPAEWGGTL